MSAEEPLLYERVARLVEAQIATGTLRGNERIPSVRSMSHANTLSVPLSSNSIRLSAVLPKVWRMPDFSVTCHADGVRLNCSNPFSMEARKVSGPTGRSSVCPANRNVSSSPYEGVPRKVRRLMAAKGNDHPSPQAPLPPPVL